jgi:hypothetical protein
MTISHRLGRSGYFELNRAAKALSRQSHPDVLVITRVMGEPRATICAGPGLGLLRPMMCNGRQCGDRVLGIRRRPLIGGCRNVRNALSGFRAEEREAREVIGFNSLAW